MAQSARKHQKADGYKPALIPAALKMIRDVNEQKPGNEAEATSMPEEKTATFTINRFATTMVVRDVEEAVQFYEGLGFKHEVVGGPVKHHHVHRDKLTIIFHPATRPEDVRPGTSVVAGSYYFDLYCYTDAVDLVVEDCKSKGIEIVNGPHYSEHWSEATIRDLNGYCITFGGGIANKDVLEQSLKK